MRGLICGLVIITILLAGTTGTAEAAGPADTGGKDPLFEWMLGGYVGLQITDAYLTQRGTSMGLTETNPVFGTGDSVTAAKVALVPLTTWGLVKLHRTHPRLARGMTIGLNAVYLGVAYSNMKVISEAE